MQYGLPPEEIGVFHLDWHEYMHYMYLPVRMATGDPIRLPQRLEFLREMIDAAIDRELDIFRKGGPMPRRYVYVTARRGYATPGNPLNRPGWHSDGFGTTDVNYVWTDAFPTVFAVGDFHGISTDHVKSIAQFEDQVHDPLIKWETAPLNTLLRLTPAMIHCAPQIPSPGGERGFVKISFSDDRYNLLGNSHNHLFDYEWEMHDRAELRNDPNYAGGDAGPQE